MNYVSLVHLLHQLVDQTETIFINFAGSYQNLMKEVDNCTAASFRKIENIEKIENSQNSTIEDATNTLLVSAAANLQEQEQQFVTIHSEDDQFFGHIDTCVDYIHTLIDEIYTIKNDSEDMWLLALNALTAGIKVGKAGGALPVITSELKKNSLRTLSDMQEILDLSFFIEEKLCGFKSLVEKVKIDQKQLIRKFGTSLTENMELFNEELWNSLNTFRSLVEQSGKIRTPLYAIMEEIQQQDIIRQSIDQVILSITEIQNNSKPAGDQFSDQLDCLAFRRIMSDLCTSMLDDLEQQITENRKVFENSSQEVRSMIIAVEKEREWFTREDKTASLSSEDSFRCFQEVFDDIGNLMPAKDEIRKQINELMQAVKKIEERFIHFASLVKNYQNINIQYRIEVEKQPALYNMRNNVYEIVCLAGRMQQNIEGMHATTKSFISIMGNTKIRYDHLCSQEEQFLYDFNSSVRAGMEQLTALWNFLKKSASGFSIFTDNFYHMFDATTKDINTLQVLIDRIGGIKEVLRRTCLESEEQLNELIASNGLFDWSVTNEKMNKVIERFTIYRHKKKAGEIAEVEIEEGTEAGVLTLF